MFRRLGEVARTVSPCVTGPLFVNVSPLSLGFAAFRELMSRTVQGSAPEGLQLVLVLELTEQAIARAPRHRSGSCTGGHDVNFAVDDFGTGYSSIGPCPTSR